MTLFSLCLLLAAVARAQTPQTPEAKRLSRAAASRFPPQHANPAQVEVVQPTVTIPPPALLKMPDLLWLTANEAAARLEPFHRRPRFSGPEDGIVIVQEPPPGADIPPTIGIPLTLGVPRLALSASAFNLPVSEDVTFTLTFDPAPPAPPNVTYRYQWHDGSEDLTTDQATAVHRFAAAGNYDVSATALINGRLPATSNAVSVSVMPPPPAQPTITETTATQPVPRPLPWALILVIAAAVSGVVFLVRLGAARSPVRSPGPPPAVSMKCGIGRVAHTIEHPERIRNPLALRLRCGIRSVAVEEGGAHA